MHDSNGSTVEINFTAHDGKWRVWINVNGVCEVRVYDATLFIGAVKLEVRQ